MVVGASTLAVSIVVAAYMAGLGVGARLAGSAAERSRHPLAVYGLLELGIGTFALLGQRFVLRGLGGLPFSVRPSCCWRAWPCCRPPSPWAPPCPCSPPGTPGTAPRRARTWAGCTPSTPPARWRARRPAASCSCRPWASPRPRRRGGRQPAGRRGRGLPGPPPPRGDRRRGRRRRRRRGLAPRRSPPGSSPPSPCRAWPPW